MSALAITAVAKGHHYDHSLEQDLGRALQDCAHSWVFIVYYCSFWHERDLNNHSNQTVVFFFHHIHTSMCCQWWIDRFIVAWPLTHAFHLPMIRWLHHCLRHSTIPSHPSTATYPQWQSRLNPVGNTLISTDVIRCLCNSRYCYGWHWS